MHLINSFAVVAALAAAPYVSTRSLAVEQFIAEGQSLVQRHTSLNARQSLANLPTCAQPSIEKGITSTTCSLTDYTCICHSTGFIDGVNAQIKTSCGADDQKATLAFADQVCTSAGAPLPKNDAAPAPAASAPAVSAPPAPAPISSAMAPPPTMSSEPASTASAMVPTITPPYPVTTSSASGNASGSANCTNTTSAPFLGAASALSSRTNVAGVVVLMAWVLGGVYFL